MDLSPISQPPSARPVPTPAVVSTPVPAQAEPLSDLTSSLAGFDLQRLAQLVGGVVLIIDENGRYLDAAASEPSQLLYPREVLISGSIGDFFSKAVTDQRVSVIRRALATHAPAKLEYSLEVGETAYWFSATVTPITDHAAIWVARDITEQRRVENLSEIQRHILELIATGAPLDSVLLALAEFMESRLPGLLCSILRLDAAGQHLTHAVAPSLPDEYIQAINGIQIGPKVGSCGTAAYRNELVIVEDIDTDPLWDDYRQLAQQFNLRACWSKPIVATEGRVLGTFALYYRQPRAPQSNELELVDTATHLASIAMERYLGEETLRQAELAEREKAAVLEAVRQASLGLTKTLEFPAVLDNVLRAVYGLMTGAKNVHVYLYDVNTDQLSFGAAVREDGLVQPLTPPRPKGLTYTVARTGQTIVVSDMNGHPLYVDAPNHWGGAIIGVPLKINQLVVGVMSVAYARPCTLAGAEARGLTLLTDQAAGSIGKARPFQAERAARDQAEALREAAGSLLTPGLDREQVLQLILEQLARVVEYDSASIMLIEGETMTLAAHRGLHSDLQGFIPTLQPRTMEHVREVLELRHPVIIPDTSQDRRWQPTKDPAANYVRCWLGVPLATKERVFGVLNVDKETPGFYTAMHGRLASAFADQAALAIEQSHLHGVLAREAQRLSLLNQLSRDLTARLEPEQVYTAIHRATVQLMPCEAFIIALISDSGDEIQMTYLIDKGQRWPNAAFPVGQGLSAQVVRSGRPLRVNNLDQLSYLTPVRFGDPEQVRSLIMVPMFLGERVTGILSAQSYREHTYTDLEEQTLSTLAFQAAIAIENARLYAETRDQLRDQQLLHECGRALAVVHETTAILDIVAERIVHRCGATALTYYSYDEATAQSRVDYEYWADQATDREKRSVIGQVSSLEQYPFTQRALETGMPQTVHHGQAGLTEAEAESLDAFAGQCIITIPLTLRSHAIGFFEVWNSQFDHTYTQGEERLLLSLAAQTAIALENAQLFAKTHRQSLELETLLDAARAVSSTRQLDDIMGVIARKMTESTDAVGCTISRWDREADSVVTWVTFRQRQVEYADAPGEIYPLTLYPATREVLHHQSYRLITHSDLAAEPSELELMQQAHISSLLMVPLVVSGQVIGLVEVFEDSVVRRFAADEIDLILGLTNQAAIAIANAQLFSALSEEKWRIELLYDLSRSLVTSLEPAEVGSRALERMCEAFAAFQGAVYLVESGEERIHLVALTGADPARIEQLDRRMEFRVGKGLTGWVAEQRSALVIDNVQAEPHWIPIPGLDEQVRSLIAAPLVAGNTLVGVINLISDHTAGFQRD